MKIPKRTLKGPSRPSLSESIQKCIDSLSKNELEIAQQHCNHILDIEPQNVVGRILLARILYRSNHVDSAKQLLQKLAHEFPTNVEIWNDLCVVLSGSKAYLEARQVLERVLPLTQHPAPLAEHYAEALMALQDPESLIRYLESHPQLTQVHRPLKTYMAEALRLQGRYQDAAAWIEQALTETPTDEGLYRRLTAIWRDAEAPQQLEQALRKWLDIAPSNPVALHLLSSLQVTDTQTYQRASDEYVRTVFDEFADHFDQSLTQLEYQAPQKIQRLLHTLIEQGILPKTRLQILDAGCGTGLCAPILKPLSSRLVGVDLSPKMLSQAQARSIYDLLVESEITEYLERCVHNPLAKEAFDLIVICDTLNYFGELSAVLAHALNALAPGGTIVFTFETLAPISQAELPHNFILATHGRFQHKPKHVEQIMRQIGYIAVDQQALELRKQAGQAVAGTLMWGQKP